MLLKRFERRRSYAAMQRRYAVAVHVAQARGDLARIDGRGPVDRRRGGRSAAPACRIANTNSGRDDEADRVERGSRTAPCRMPIRTPAMPGPDDLRRGPGDLELGVALDELVALDERRQVHWYATSKKTVRQPLMKPTT